MPRSKKIGRPKLPKDKQKHYYSVRLTDADRKLLEKLYGTVQNALQEKLDQLKIDTKD